MIAPLVALALAATGGIETLGPKLTAPATRIVTVAPSLTEAVIALGAGERLVGVSRFDELKEVASLPRIGGFVDPSVEAILAVKPDLVVVQPGPGNQRPMEKLAELGVSVLVLPLHSIDEVESALRALGRALGKSERGAQLADDIERARREVRARSLRVPKVRVLFVYGFEPLVVAGRGSFADALLADAGGINVAGDSNAPYPVYSAESAVRARPDVVVDAADVDTGRERFATLEGLKQARWVKPPSQALLHPGPKLAQALRELFALLHHDQGM